MDKSIIPMGKAYVKSLKSAIDEAKEKGWVPIVDCIKTYLVFLFVVFLENFGKI